MPLTVPDETLVATGLNEEEARVELACLLFDAGRLTFGHAARFARLDEEQFDQALISRDIPLYRYTQEMLDQDFRHLKELRDRSPVGSR